MGFFPDIGGDHLWEDQRGEVRRAGPLLVGRTKWEEIHSTMSNIDLRDYIGESGQVV